MKELYIKTAKPLISHHCNSNFDITKTSKRVSVRRNIRLRTLLFLMNRKKQNYVVKLHITQTICIWSGHASACNISSSLYLHNFPNISPISFFSLPYITDRRYFGANTRWYWHRHFECAKLSSSIWIPLTYFICGLRIRLYYIREVLFFYSPPKLFLPHQLSWWLFHKKSKQNPVRFCLLMVELRGFVRSEVTA